MSLRPRLARQVDAAVTPVGRRQAVNCLLKDSCGLAVPAENLKAPGTLHGDVGVSEPASPL